MADHAGEASAAFVPAPGSRRTAARHSGAGRGSPGGGAQASAAVEVTGLHKRYRDRIAVDDVSFTVAEGEVFGILGPNGAGKTTTAECIVGLRAPDRGTIGVLGLSPQRDRTRLCRLLGAQLQESELPDRLTAGEALDLYAAFHRSPRDPGELLSALGLADQRRTRYRKLSGGQKQRLSVALALIGRPRIAVLDELSTGLDPLARRDLRTVVRGLRDEGVTVLLVTHSMPEAEQLCDRVVVLNAGRVSAEGSPAELADRFGEWQIRFRPSAPPPPGWTAALPAGTAVSAAGGELAVTGRGDLPAVVTAVLRRHGITAEHLRIRQPGLEDAFLALTAGRH